MKPGRHSRTTVACHEYRVHDKTPPTPLQLQLSLPPIAACRRCRAPMRCELRRARVPAQRPPAGPSSASLFIRVAQHGQTADAERQPDAVCKQTRARANAGVEGSEGRGELRRGCDTVRWTRPPSQPGSAMAACSLAGKAPERRCSLDSPREAPGAWRPAHAGGPSRRTAPDESWSRRLAGRRRVLRQTGRRRGRGGVGVGREVGGRDRPDRPRLARALYCSVGPESARGRGVGRVSS
jgi:hypothetical protein